MAHNIFYYLALPLDHEGVVITKFCLFFDFQSVVQLPAYISQSDPVMNFFRPLSNDLMAPDVTAR